MIRMMQPADLPALKALWAAAFGDSADYAEMAISRFAGPQNVCVAEEDGAPVGLLLAVPVQLGVRQGVYDCGLAVASEYRRRGIGAALLGFAHAAAAARGCSFAALVPEQPSLFAWYEKQGFTRAFGLRRVHRSIRRNIWSQAEFDSVPAKRLCDLRREYCPDIVQMSPAAMVQELTDLYSRGITIVSSEDGYGLYFRKGETLHFVELMAEGDRAAERLMEAAREKEVVVEDAEITVGANQNLFLGEGRREDHGMIRFFGEPFDVSESYLRLMLDV